MRIDFIVPNGGVCDIEASPGSREVLSIGV